MPVKRLFKAGIRPDHPVWQDLSKARYERLTDVYQRDSGQSHRARRNNASGLCRRGRSNQGYFKQELAVYGRAGESLYDYAPALIKAMKLGNRNTFFCSIVPKMTGNYYPHSPLKVTLWQTGSLALRWLDYGG